MSYNNYSKSNNAIGTERFGRFPASILAKKLGVKTGAIKSILSSYEWHHTSKWFNCTDYYSIDDAEERIDELRAWKADKIIEKDLGLCHGEYLAWSGTRNYPNAKTVRFTNTRIIKKGDWLTLYLPSEKIRKNKNTKGFWFSIEKDLIEAKN